MAMLAKLPAIVNVNLNSCPQLKGSFFAGETFKADDPVCALASSGLATLNLASTGLNGSFFPPCLLGPRSTLEVLRIGTPSFVSESLSPTQAWGCVVREQCRYWGLGIVAYLLIVKLHEKFIRS